MNESDVRRIVQSELGRSGDGGGGSPHSCLDDLLGCYLGLIWLPIGLWFVMYLFITVIGFNDQHRGNMLQGWVLWAKWAGIAVVASLPAVLVTWLAERRERDDDDNA